MFQVLIFLKSHVDSGDPMLFLFDRTYCLIVDGKSAEGSIWEALHFAGHNRLDNLCAIFDTNRLGQYEPTSLQHNMEVYRKRLEAFGFTLSLSTDTM
jgi:transketolase N-terminal domain/subunit